MTEKTKNIHHLENPQVTSPQYESADDINLADLVGAIWKTRKPWFFSMIIISLLFWGAWAAKFLLNPAPLSYSLPVTFTFQGIEQGNYPNGSAFLRSDLIAPSVIKAVYDRNELQQYGLSLDSFYPMIRVIPYALDQAQIQKKYQIQLANKKITTQEIDEISKRQKEEMEQSSLRGARIVFTAKKSLLPINIIANILSDVPETWAAKAIEERGVLKLDLEIIGESIFQQNILEQLDYMISFDYLSEKVKLIDKNIETLKQQPNGLTARDSESGMTLPELQFRLDDVKNYQLSLLVNPTHELGLSKNKKITLHYYQNKLLELQQEQNELFEKAKLTRRTYQVYMGNMQNQLNSSKSSAQVAAVMPGNVTTQLGDTFLDRIMELSDKASDIVYRQELSRKQQEYEERSIEISGVILKVKRNIQSLSDDMDLKKDQEVRDYFYSQIKEGIPSLLVQLRGINHIVNQLQKQIGIQNRGGVNNLYLPASENLDVAGGYVRLAENQIVIYLVLLLLASIVFVPIVMARNAVSKRDEAAN